MNIVIPGGHLTPALALIDYVATQDSTVHFLFWGRTFSQQKLRQQSQEAAEVATRPNTTFYAYDAPRWGSQAVWQKIIITIRLAGAVLRAMVGLLAQHADVVLSFGGYQAVPIGIAAWVLGIPVLTHEQTRVLGTGTRVLARFAQAIAVSYPESLSDLPPAPRSKATVTGNLVRPGLLQPVAAPDWWQNTSFPVLFITGGNQGSLALNTLVMSAMAAVSSEWYVIHQCGNPTADHEYQQELEAVRQQLPLSQQSRFVVKKWFSEQELAWIWQHADAVLCRAGANTVTEVLSFRVPAIFVPLPHAVRDEQRRNILPLVAAKGAYLLEQDTLSEESLLVALKHVRTHASMMANALRKLQPPKDAAVTLWQMVRQRV